MWTKQSENNFSESEDILTRKKISKSCFILNDPNFIFHPSIWLRTWAVDAKYDSATKDNFGSFRITY